MIRRIGIALALVSSAATARADTSVMDGATGAGSRERAAGFVSLDHGDLGKAEARFEKALSYDPGDGDALGGMGVVRLRQRRFAEAAGLLARAARAGRAGQWTQALDTARYFAALDVARAELASGGIDEARRSGEALIASGYPHDEGARELLAGIAADQGRHADAATLFTQAARRSAAGDVPRLSAAAARETARAASASGDIVGAGVALKAGLAIAPDDIWLRHDYAHLLIAMGQAEQAAEVIAPLSERADAKALYAAALIAAELHRPAQADALMMRIPAADRDPSMKALAADVALDLDLERAQALAHAHGGDAAVREYRRIAARPGIGIDRRTTIANALLALGDDGHAAAIASDALSAQPIDIRQRAALADIVARSGRAARTKGDGALALARLRAARDASPRDLPESAAQVRLDAEITDLWRERADRAEAGIAYRHRSGDAGLGRLDEVVASARASTSVGMGRVEMRGQAVSLDAGTPRGSAQARFGFSPTLTLGLPSAFGVAGRQRASGVEMAIGYASASFGVEGGLTTVGIGSARAIGRAALTARPSGGVTVEAWAERKPLTDSIVSYAGTRDPARGAAWGRIMRSAAGGSLSADRDGSGLYAQVRYGSYDGLHVRTNHAQQIDAGGYLRLRRRGDGVLSAGINLDVQHFAHNENGYSFSTGGYFSPQRFVAISVPIRYRLTAHDTELSVSATPGFQSYREASAPLYPDDRTEQARLQALSRQDPRVMTRRDANVARGFAFATQVSAFRYIQPGVRIGGEGAYDSFGSYREFRFSAALRVSFGDGAPAIVSGGTGS